MGSQRLSEGTLFVVATPIGNLDDLSPRAREVLAGVDLIAAEDTRVTGRLLSHFSIKCRQTALHEHNEKEKSGDIIRRLSGGESVALVSDAGTPLISDPGFTLIRLALEAGIPVLPVPGPTAFVAALSVSGLATDRFCFEGFLPAKRPMRRRRLTELMRESRTCVFYESVHRIAATVDDMVTVFGALRRASIGRELTKMHEQCVTAELGSLAEMLSVGTIPQKGEFVVVVEGASPTGVADASINVDALLRELTEALPGKQAVDVTSRITGISRNQLYRKMLELKAEKP